MDITEIFINKTGTSKKIAHISADNIIRMLINGSIIMMGECTNAMQYDSLTTLLNFLKVTQSFEKFENGRLRFTKIY